MFFYQVSLVVIFVFTFQIAAQSGKFFHLSDWHVDPYYIPTKSPSTFCHNLTEFIPPHPIPDRYFNERDTVKLFAEGAPNYNFGQYGCDSTLALVQTAIQSMQTTLPDPDFILNSGDMSAHYLPTPESRTVSINDTTVAIREAYPGVPFYPSLGNNDCYPDYYLSYEKGVPNNWLENVFQIWSTYADIPADQQNNFIHGGFYSANLNDSVVLLSLNTIYWCTSHLPAWSPEQEPDPGYQFQWLNQTLQAAAADSKLVYILGHIPPGSGWYQEYLSQYASIIFPYRDIIIAQFFGHTHRDEFHLMSDSSSETNSTFGFYMQAPSLTPENNNNPSYRIVEYDPSSWVVLDHYQYICDLLQLQRTSKANWVLEYEFGKLYGVPSVTLDSLRVVIDKIQTNTILFNAWNENYDTQYESPSTRLSTLCKMYYMFSADISQCEDNGVYQDSF